MGSQPQAPNEVARDALQLQANTATELLKALDRAAIFKLVSERIYALSGGAIVSMSEFDVPASTITVREVRCTDEEARRLAAALGRNPVGLTLPMPDEVRKNWHPGELTPVLGGFDELLFSQVPVDVSRELERQLDVGDAYAMACAYDKDILGMVAVITHQRGPVPNKEVIETLIAQTALALKRVRAEEARRSTEERFRLLFENTSDGVWIETLDGVICEINDAYCAMSGYARPELEGMSVSRLEAVEDPEALDVRLKRIVAAGHDRFESKHRRKNGSTFDVDITALYLDGEGGRIAIFTRDITERKRGERLLALRNAVTSTLADADTVDAAAPSLLEHLGHYLGWSAGELWLLDGAGPHLRRQAFWQAPGTAAMDEILAQGASLTFAKGEGFPGRVWARDEPLWVRDVAKECADLPRAPALRRAAVRGLFGFPIRVGAETLGVVFLLGPETAERDQALLEFSGALGSQIGQFIERKHAEAERDSLAQQRQLALDAARLGWWHYDLATREATYDRRYMEILGVSGGEHPNDELLKQVHPEDLPRVMAEIEAALDPVEPKPYSTEYRVNRPDGSLRWVQAHGLPVFEGKGSARRAASFIGTIQDVTERKSAEEALREVDRRRTEFLAVLSHELRNPLAPIRNSLYILDRAVPGGDQARRAKTVIDRQVSQLARLVDDLLDVTRITRGKVQLQRERLELNDLVRRTMEDHRFLFEKGGVQFEVETTREPIFVCADWNRLAQAIGNLLQNSAKFTPRGGSVSVSLSVDPGDRQAVIRVVDNGVGIPPDILEHLFQPFMQADRTLDRSKGGLGLGLALVKGMVELHGGTVSGTSEGVGKGSVFTVRLPLDESMRIAEPVPAAGEGAAGRRVLVIEDNVDAAESMRELLQLDAHEVAVAYDGPDGLAKARAFHPDVVLCDIGLPGMSGFDVARAFRADPGLRGAFLIALSGYALPEDLHRAHQAGFDRHLAKPPNLEALETLIAHAPA